jgi:hypothetical protein
MHDKSIPDGYILIDPPVGQFSSEEDILAWIEELNSFPDRPEVREAITDAKKILQCKRECKE